MDKPSVTCRFLFNSDFCVLVAATLPDAVSGVYTCALSFTSLCNSTTDH